MTDEPAKTPDLTSDEIFPLGWGLVFRVVCAPKGKTDEEISDAVTAKDPPGTMNNRWIVSSDESAAAHAQWCEAYKVTTARAPCPDCADRVHVLMNC